jgi:pilus assembly protein CpaB
MKFSLNFLVSILIGLLITISLVYFLGIGGDGSRSGPPVLVATAQIEAGNLIQKEQIKLIKWESSDAPPGSYADPTKLDGRVARQTIYNGEPILDLKLAPIGSKVGMESLITVGKRAITVRVNDVIGVAGFALPGSYVDILANIKDRSGQSYSKVVLSRVKVLAVAQETEVDTNKPKIVNAVTLELSPQESERLDLARSIGSLSLVLRNELDKDIESSRGARVEDLLSNKNYHNATDMNLSNEDSSDSVKFDSPKDKSKNSSGSQGGGTGHVEEIRGLSRGRVSN